LPKLSLYSIFHGNLNYSSIDKELYEHVIDTCYWPLIDLVKEFDFKPGLEFPLNTLQKINDIDSLFLPELKQLVKEQKIEIICSSREQTIFPLIPEEINLQNLKFGKKEFEKIFEREIDTAFVNEQLFSPGLISLYKKSGIKNIITVWEWANQISEQKNEIKFHPSKLQSQSDETLNALWSSYIAYQKFQRYITKDYEKNEYLSYILKQKNSEKDSCFPLYGSDLEIFGYKNPVDRSDPDGNEINRFRELLNSINDLPDLEFLFPSEILKKFPPDEKILLNSAKYSILQKKQDKFSITRWAICGRDNSNRNTICYKIYKKILHLKSLEEKKLSDENLTNQLIDTWASDFRTHTTDSKNHTFSTLTNSLNSNLDERLNAVKQKKFENTSDDITLFNPNDSDWIGLPYEIKLFFKSNYIKNDFKFFYENKEISSQIENKKFYKDGSLRSCIVIFEPTIPKNSFISINLEETTKFENSNQILSDNASTDNIELSLLSSRGASINELNFPKIYNKPLIRFLEHGTFDDTHLSPDFFSGHTVSFDRDGKKITDLIRTEIHKEYQNNSVRTKLFTKLNLPFGVLIKEFFLYKNHPITDLKYTFYFKDFRPGSFRTAILTLNPDIFSKDEISFSLHNGGSLESYNLSGQLIAQDESTDPRFSNSGCNGTTNSIIDLGDSKKGITIFSDKSKWYSVPLLNFRELRENYFARISNSMMELDDTSMAWWKGRKQAEFRLIGRKDGISNNLNKSNLFFNGLISKSNNNNFSIEN
tara:strand:+ start:45089 stop:47377 length:2289 start_codon:yes stop_codon:yes gene_type:complete